MEEKPKISQNMSELSDSDKKKDWNKKYRSDLTRFQKIQFYIASGGKAIIQGLMRAAFIKYYTDYIGLEVQWLGIIYLIFTIWAALNDPIFGLWLDKRPFKPGKGKYRPAFIKSIPFLILITLAFPWASPSWSQLGISLYLFAALTLWETALTLFSVTYESIAINIFLTTDERTEVEVIDNYIGAVSIIGSSLPLMIFDLDVSNTVILVFFGIITLIGGLIMAVSIPVVREKEEFYAHEKQEQTTLKDIFIEIWGLLKDKTFVIYFLTFLLLQRVASSYILGLAYFYDNLILSTNFWTGLPDILIGALGLLLYPFIAKGIRKYGSKKVLLYMMVISLIGYLILAFVPGTKGDELETVKILGLDVPSESSYWIATVVWFVVYIGFCAVYTTNGPIQKRLIDYLELKTGKRRPGTVKGIIGVLMTPGEAIYIFLFTTILSVFNYDGDSKIQDRTAQIGIRIATAVMPAILIVLGLFVFSKYPIDKAKNDEIEAEMISLHGSRADSHQESID